ncbi:GAF domain-containing protein [Microbacterium esteraromaticum]|uniref:GAF domain-containing protein n=1 Tax=Microbacterium esteraromaticum TaxID=57043 RepID=A0A7D7W662_9MICO|nr:GAF domain-containing protein [Microbacterium esteraromaticum]QMU95798.1 GAF domain-containing protein [Microbacterium esteraromaticum]
MATTPDLADLARSLVRVHDAVLSGARPPEHPRPVVARSWARTMNLGVDPEGRSRRDPLAWSQVEERRRRSPLSTVLDELRMPLLAAADAASYLVVVTDADGVVLWRSGAPGVKMQADRLGFVEGAVWTEDAVGTNAIGTALAEASPVQLFSAEHFENAQVPWYCTASPVHDPMDGTLLGIVDVSGPALTLHPAIRALVGASVQLAQARLQRRHGDRLERLRRTVHPLLAGVGGPLLVVDDAGWVATQQGLAPRDRIEAPQADRAVAVPGLGICMPERLADGWLIRPSEQRAALEAVIDVSGAQALLEVRGPASAWRSALSPRHAELLVALAERGRAGMNAAELSIRLFGDAAHQVTVRAEFSRLRRAIGALVAGNPYRIAEGVALSVRRSRG